MQEHPTTHNHPLSEQDLRNIFQIYIDHGIKEWDYDDLQRIYDGAIGHVTQLLYTTDPEEIEDLFTELDNILTSNCWLQTNGGCSSSATSDSYDTYEFNMTPFKVIARAYGRLC